MNDGEIKAKLNDHKLWLESKGTKGRQAILEEANLKGANLAEANLDEADLTRANLGGANLAGAHLAGAYLARANLTWTNLERANLAGAHLVGANLANANLEGANLAGANLEGADLCNIKGKEIMTMQFEQHFAYYCESIAKIGCISMPLDKWLKNYKDIGKKHNYTTKQIKVYGDWLKYCKNSLSEE